MEQCRVILIDDHRLFADAIKSFIEPEFKVVDVFIDCQSLLKQASHLQTDLIVLDIGMPKINGLNAGRHLKQALPAVKLIYLTAHWRPDLVSEAFELGASAYVLKSAIGSELIEALRAVKNGGTFVSPALTEGKVDIRVEDLIQRDPDHHLTPRQKEVLHLLTEGKSFKEVAHILDISPSTVEYHKYSIMKQHGIKTNSDLFEFAHKVLPLGDP